MARKLADVQLVGFCQLLKMTKKIVKLILYVPGPLRTDLRKTDEYNIYLMNVHGYIIPQCPVKGRVQNDC